MTCYISDAAKRRVQQWLRGDPSELRPSGLEILERYRTINSGLGEEQRLAFSDRQLIPVGPRGRDGLTDHQLQEHFEAASRQLRETTCVALIAALESDLLSDYWNRIGERRTDVLSIAYRSEHNQRPSTKDARAKVHFNRHILPVIAVVFRGHASAREVEAVVRLVSQFRNWAAHGQFSVCRYQDNPDPEDVFDLIRVMLNAVPAAPGLPAW